MKTLEGPKTKTERQIRTFLPVLADSSKELPTEVELLQVGMWDTPYHGMFMITAEDLQQYKANFDAGVAQPSVGFGLPIDFAHRDNLEAAGWIKELIIKGESLWGVVEWTTAGAEALKGGLYKCFSPMFYPRSYGGWEDPEQMGFYVENVLAGGGLTNIPLFKGLTPVMASSASGDKLDASERKNIIYVSASENNNKESSMNLEELRKKEVSTLTTEERAFLAEKKAELTAEEQKALGFEEAAAPVVANPENPEVPPADTGTAQSVITTQQDEEANKIAASVKAGTHMVVEASRFNAMEASIKEYETKKAEDFVKTHVERGAIVADQGKVWVDQLLGAQGSQRETLETMLKNLPENKVVTASAQGSDEATTESTATAEISKQAKGKVEAAAKEGKALSIGDATSQVLRENPDLATQYQNEATRKEA